MEKELHKKEENEKEVEKERIISEIEGPKMLDL